MDHLKSYDILNYNIDDSNHPGTLIYFFHSLNPFYKILFSITSTTGYIYSFICTFLKLYYLASVQDKSLTGQFLSTCLFSEIKFCFATYSSTFLVSSI